MKPDVKALWDDLAQRHQLDPHRKAASLFQAFNRTADELARTLADLEARCTALTEQWRAEDQVLRLSRVRPVCAKCGATNLEHFYSSKRDGRTLCATCFAPRVEQSVARQTDAPNNLSHQQ